MKIKEIIHRGSLEYVQEDGTEIYSWTVGEEIVRCRDCKQFHIFQQNKRYIAAPSCCKFQIMLPDPDGFCAWGVRCND